MTIPVILATTDSLTDRPAGILLGFVFVVMVLVLLALATSLMGRGFVAWDKKTKATQPQARATLSHVAAEAAGDVAAEGRIAAVIAAAVYTTLGTRHRIVSIRTRHGTSGWAAEGRRELFSSRRFQKKGK